MHNYLLYYKKDKTIKQTKFENVMDTLYELRAIVPTKERINDYIKKGSKSNIKSYLKSKNAVDIIDDIKKSISEIDNKIPLYDPYKKNLFIINKENVYNRVTYQSYRFPDKPLIGILMKKRTELEPLIQKLQNINTDKTLKEYELIHKKISLEEEYHKLGLMLEFLESFDIDILETTYVKVFYFYANEVGKNITVCERPSFMPHFTHLKPYYTRSELINLALNMEIIKPDNKFYDQENVMKLCDKVIKNDISSDIITKHQEHIIKHNKIGVVQFYSLQGSYFINQYLRGLTNYEFKNEILESVIRSIWELILSAPEFDKEYILYRFIHDDSYLKHLKIGDTFIDPSFISTTRDPFYRAETYKFGFILIKINIPAKIKGVGLCLETYSHFPEEQEIILAPLSALRLDKKDENALYYHTDNMFASKVLTRYEFTFISKDTSKMIKFVDRPLIDNTRGVIDFLLLKKHVSLTIYEKIKNFMNENVNDIYQFKTKIGNLTLNLIVEWYDSTNAYKKFYASTTNNGFSIYTFRDNYILFIIELGENNNKPYMYVNFYFKYASSDKNKTIDDNDFVEFLSKVAYYFNIKDVILYTEYSSCDTSFNGKLNEQFDKNDIKLYHGGNYCIDFYRYLKYKEKRFKNNKINIDSTELRPQFSYYELDRLKTIKPTQILNRDDRDEIYQMYTKTYKLFFKEENDNLADFFIWMVENHCVYHRLFIKKMHRLYNINNPFSYDYYILDSGRHLYNKGLISNPPILDESIKSQNNLQISDRVPKNEYRLQYYKRERVP